MPPCVCVGRTAVGPLGAIVSRRRVHSKAGKACLVSRLHGSCQAARPLFLVRVHATLELGWAVMGCSQQAMPTACRAVKLRQRHSPGKFGACLLEGMPGRAIARPISAVAGARLYVCVPALTRGPSTALFCIFARGGWLTSSIHGCLRFQHPPLAGSDQLLAPCTILQALQPSQQTPACPCVLRPGLSRTAFAHAVSVRSWLLRHRGQ